VLELGFRLVALMLGLVVSGLFMTGGASTGMVAFTGMGLEAALLDLPASAFNRFGFELNRAFMACTIALKFNLNPPSQA
jgi:hypothetical protein